MNRWYKRFRQRWQELATRWLPYRAAECADDELPTNFRPRRIYLLGDPAWRVAFVCPCGCGEIVELCLLENVKPRWRATTDATGLVTLHPSVWKKGGCHSHYVIRDGRIRWV